MSDPDLIRELDIAAAALNEDQRRCVSCKHWSNPWTSNDYTYSLAREKLATSNLNEWGICRLIDMPDWRQAPEVTAFVQDGSDYAADFHTRGDFGCVLWTETETGP